MRCSFVMIIPILRWFKLYQQEKIIAKAGCWDRSLTTPRLGFYSVSETTQTSKSYSSIVLRSLIDSSVQNPRHPKLTKMTTVETRKTLKFTKMCKFLGFMEDQAGKIHIFRITKSNE